MYIYIYIYMCVCVCEYIRVYYIPEDRATPQGTYSATLSM